MTITVSEVFSLQALQQFPASNWARDNHVVLDSRILSTKTTIKRHDLESAAGVNTEQPDRKSVV